MRFLAGAATGALWTYLFMSGLTWHDLKLASGLMLGSGLVIVPVVLALRWASRADPAPSE